MNPNDGANRQSMLDRFRAAARIDTDNWRDPAHDLEAIRLATPEERKAIEQFLIARGVSHYIDVEALAFIDSPEAHRALLAAFHTGSTEVRAAVARLAPQLIPTNEQLSELLRRIDECDAYKGLDLTLQQIELHHPLPVIQAMLQRVAREPGVVAVHYAALLLYLHGKATSAFDWEQRPFFLRFNPGDEADRRQAFTELCEQIGYASASYRAEWPSHKQEE